MINNNALSGTGDGPAADSSELKRRLANDEKLISLAVHGLYKGLANLGDFLAIGTVGSGFVDRGSPMDSMVYLERHRHMVHSCSREGMLEVLSGVRHHWLLGFDRTDIDKNKDNG